MEKVTIIVFLNWGYIFVKITNHVYPVYVFWPSRIHNTIVVMTPLSSFLVWIFSWNVVALWGHDDLCGQCQSHCVFKTITFATASYASVQQWCLLVGLITLINCCTWKDQAYLAHRQTLSKQFIHFEACDAHALTSALTEPWMGSDEEPNEGK